MVPGSCLCFTVPGILFTRTQMENCMKILAVIFLALPVSLHAQPDNKPVIKGNKLYKEGKFDEAIVEYRKAAATDPNNPVIQYNLGNAVFKKENFDEAL